MTRPPFNLAKSLDPTASPKTLYRHLLRASRRHPDEHVAKYFAARWRARAEQLLQANFDQPRLQSRMDASRRVLRKLQRAANGVPADFEWSLKNAYGLSGKSRHFLSSPFLLPSVLPVAEPIQAGNPASVPPTYSPLLLMLLQSPVVRDHPISLQQLLVPPTLPAQGVPRHPELYIRPFLPPWLEAKRRWEYFRWLLTEVSGSRPRMRFPLVVRVVNQEPGEDVAPKLRALGVNWAAYADGERERVLTWLEVKAGRGADARFLAPKRPPVSPETIAQLAASTPDPIPAPPVNPAPAAAPAARDPVDHRQVYRRILSQLPIVTIDMARIRTPTVWFSAGLSPFSHNGPGLFYRVSQDDVGYTGDRRPFLKKKVARKNAIAASNEVKD